MARKITVYHNPRCSKSRATVEWLTQQGYEFDIVEYLKNPLNETELRTLLIQLDLRVDDIIRKGEKRYQELGLSRGNHDDEALLGAIIDNPILLERPIVSSGSEAVIGRPLENVIELFDEL